MIMSSVCLHYDLDYFLILNIFCCLNSFFLLMLTVCFCGFTLQPFVLLLHTPEFIIKALFLFLLRAAMPFHVSFITFMGVFALCFICNKAKPLYHQKAYLLTLCVRLTKRLLKVTLCSVSSTMSYTFITRQPQIMLTLTLISPCLSSADNTCKELLNALVEMPNNICCKQQLKSLLVLQIAEGGPSPWAQRSSWINFTILICAER